MLEAVLVLVVRDLACHVAFAVLLRKEGRAGRTITIDCRKVRVRMYCFVALAEHQPQQLAS